VFACFGISTLLRPENVSLSLPDRPDRCKYTLRQSKLPYLSFPPIGSPVSQEAGFTGELSFVDNGKQIFKIDKCNNIDRINPRLPLMIGDITFYPDEIFCYELYREMLPSEVSEEILSEFTHAYLLSNLIRVSVLHTNFDICYEGSGRVFVCGDESAYLIRIEREAEDTRPDRARELNHYGRLV
jgi:hypothetical protein